MSSVPSGNAGGKEQGSSDNPVLSHPSSPPSIVSPYSGRQGPRPASWLVPNPCHTFRAMNNVRCRLQRQCQSFLCLPKAWGRGVGLLAVYNFDRCCQATTRYGPSFSLSPSLSRQYSRPLCEGGYEPSSPLDRKTLRF